GLGPGIQYAGIPRRGESRMPPSEITADLSREHQFEQDLAEFLDNAPVGMLWLAEDGSILRANRFQLELLGCCHAELVGHHLARFCADREACDELLKCVRRGDELRSYAIRLRSSDGSIKHVLIDSSV